MTAQQAGVKTLVLTHLLAQVDQPGIREEIVHRIRCVFDGRIIWGEDLMQIDVRSGQISGIEPRT